MLAMALVLAVPVPSRADFINVTFSSEYDDCDIQGVVPFQPLNVYFVAGTRLAPTPLQQGIRAAEFAVAGVPPSWFILSALPNPSASSVVGDPFAGGVAMLFPTCQDWSGPNCWVPLYSVTFFPTEPVPPMTLDVVGHGSSVQCPGSSPALAACDPGSTPVCVPGGRGYINSFECRVQAGQSDGCIIAVEQRSWSAVKRLYDSR
jgi:hypothetical protein